MVKPESVSINNVRYYNSLDLKKFDLNYFYGCIKLTRKIIDKKNIPNESYTYATYNVHTKKWRIYDKEEKIPTRANLYIALEWADQQIPKLREIVENNKKITNEKKINKKTKKIIKENDKNNSNNAIDDIDDDNNNDNDNNDDNDNSINDIDNKDNIANNGYEYLQAPEILELEDNEKFKYENDNIIEIETRGERKYDCVYFLMSDVANTFELPGLASTLTHNKSDYNINEHYVYFICPNNGMTKTQQKKKPRVQKLMYITYEGMIKILYCSKSSKAKAFRSWATTTLFTAQMGTKEQKYELSSKILGVSPNAVKEVFKAYASSLPCVYLFTLGDVKTLRESMKIDTNYIDNMIVCKYGQINNLARRTIDHTRNFSKIKDVVVNLKYYSYIDPQYISSAEIDIKDYFEEMNVKINYEKNEELIIVNPSSFKNIEKQYKLISTNYAGHVKELIKQLETTKTANEIEMLKKDMLIREEKEKVELLKKDIDLLKKI
jgi:hypothetical protein